MPHSNKIDKINVRMYRIGTGDFFLLQFKNDINISFKLMIDCGCINGGKDDFEDKVEDLKTITDGVIDLLIVTHEHADHINGFRLASDIFDNITFKKVWFAWTEADENFANNFRKEHSKIKNTVSVVAKKLNGFIADGSFKKIYSQDYNSLMMMESTEHFVKSLTGLSSLIDDNDQPIPLDSIPTMEDILIKNKVIKDDTIVEFYEPGNVIENLQGLEGIRFFILAPPKDNNLIKKEEIKGEGYEKREKKSTLDMAFLNVFSNEISGDDLLPFNQNYVLKDSHPVKDDYLSEKNLWRNIDKDWLLNAGSLALRHETSINNTSLAVAIQFTDSERILLFPGDAEQGSWLSWHKDLEWSFKDKNGKNLKVNAEYILSNTVFYKVSHHLSQNGTPRSKGLEMFKQDELAVMVTLDFNKINNGWLNTMPNDLIGSELIRKTRGKIFFVGDRNKIIKNIKTDRVTLSKTNLETIEKLNKPFDGKFFIEHEVVG